MSMIQVVNKRTGAKGIYIGRGNPRIKKSVLGNPFKMKSEADRDFVVEKYRAWLDDEMKKKGGDVWNEIMRLVEKAKRGESINLVCWCAPKRCHGDVVKAKIEEILARDELASVENTFATCEEVEEQVQEPGSIRVVNKRTGGKGVYIGRGNRRTKGSLLGNPFKMKSEADRNLVVEKYQKWLGNEMNQQDGAVRNEVLRLAKRVKRGESINLVCWCAPKRCHGDVVKEAVEHLISNEEEDSKEQSMQTGKEGQVKGMGTGDEKYNQARGPGDHGAHKGGDESPKKTSSGRIRKKRSLSSAD